MALSQSHSGTAIHTPHSNMMKLRFREWDIIVLLPIYYLWQTWLVFGDLLGYLWCASLFFSVFSSRVSDTGKMWIIITGITVVTTQGQSQASIQVTWSVWTNSRQVCHGILTFLIHHSSMDRARWPLIGWELPRPLVSAVIYSPEPREKNRK